MVPLARRMACKLPASIDMVIGPLVNLASSFIESLIPGSSNSSGSPSTKDANQTSPFAQLLSGLQQSNAVPFQTVSQQIASYLQTGAQSATANGNTALASQLTQLSTDFTNVSTSGQLPNF
jgi:hypothetical protein